MINRIINTYLSSLKERGINFDDYFVDSEYSRVSDLLKMVNLPNRVMLDSRIDVQNMSKNLKSLYNSFEDCCYSFDNTFVSVKDFELTGYIASMLVEKLYTRCLVEDVTIPLILYVDTEALVEDMGVTISMDRGTDLTLADYIYKFQNPLDVINNYIYTARYVIWDRFSLNFSEYFNKSIYAILKSRYNNCLGNLFFSDMEYKLFMENLKGKSTSILNILNINAGIFNLNTEQKQGKIKLIKGDNQNA